MRVDIIILSKASSPELKEMTQNCIDSLYASLKEIEVDVLVLEQIPDIEYSNAKTILKTEEFNYNKFLNYANGLTANPYIVYCNNDLLFFDGWLEELIYTMQKNNIMSASPVDRNFYKDRFISKKLIEGYTVGYFFNGACFCWDREILDIIPEFNEDSTFWAADHQVSEQLKENKIKHYLIASSYFFHLVSQTLRLITDKEEYNNITTKQVQKFNKRYNQNIRNAGIGE